jgi:hypothetical protein
MRCPKGMVWSPVLGKCVKVKSDSGFNKVTPKNTNNTDPGFSKTLTPEQIEQLKNKPKPQIDKRGGMNFKKGGSTAAWQRKEGKNPEGGLNAKGVASYRKANPGSKLKTAVTTKPSKLDPDSKSAKRRKSFCSRMSGMKKKLTSSKTANDPNSRINKSLRKWNC